MYIYIISHLSLLAIWRAAGEQFQLANRVRARRNSVGARGVCRAARLCALDESEEFVGRVDVGAGGAEQLGDARGVVGQHELLAAFRR